MFNISKFIDNFSKNKYIIYGLLSGSSNEYGKYFSLNMSKYNRQPCKLRMFTHVNVKNSNELYKSDFVYYFNYTCNMCYITHNQDKALSIIKYVIENNKNFGVIHIINTNNYDMLAKFLEYNACIVYTDDEILENKISYNIQKFDKNFIDNISPSTIYKDLTQHIFLFLLFSLKDIQESDIKQAIDVNKKLVSNVDNPYEDNNIIQPSSNNELDKSIVVNTYKGDMMMADMLNN